MSEYDGEVSNDISKGESNESTDSQTSKTNSVIKLLRAKISNLVLADKLALIILVVALIATTSFMFISTITRDEREVNRLVEPLLISMERSDNWEKEYRVGELHMKNKFQGDFTVEVKNKEENKWELFTSYSIIKRDGEWYYDN